MSTADYYASTEGPTASRPVHSALDLSKLEAAGFYMPDWEEELGGCSYSFVNWAMLFSRLNRDMLTPGLSADGLQSVRSASTRRRRAPCPA